MSSPTRYASPSNRAMSRPRHSPPPSFMISHCQFLREPYTPHLPGEAVPLRVGCPPVVESGDLLFQTVQGLSPKRAAEKLAEDFGVRYEGLQTWQPQRRPSVISKLAAIVGTASLTASNKFIVMPPFPVCKRGEKRRSGNRRSFLCAGSGIHISVIFSIGISEILRYGGMLGTVYSGCDGLRHLLGGCLGMAE